MGARCAFVVPGLLLPVLLFAQAHQGDITINVTDASGAAVSANGVAVSVESGVRHPFKTDEQGSYTLSGLPYGSYQLRITKQGFSTASVIVDLHSAKVSRSITLSVGRQQF